MATRTRRPKPAPERLSRGPVFCAVLAGCSWTWAIAILATRHHLVGTYSAVVAAPPLWGIIGLPLPVLSLTLALGGFMTWLALACVRANPDRFPRPAAWLLASCFVPVLDFFRLAGIDDIPVTFVEPLALIAITTLTVEGMAARLQIPSRAEHVIASLPWVGLVWLASVVLGTWYVHQSLRAYNHFMLGFNDFGHFAQRVANTWAGRGFLLETPSLPPFWDHFNPGLVLLTPLWGLWPDPRLFMVLQAACIVLSAPILYAIARQLQATRMEAALWAIAYLVYPPVSQLNLSFSYGWHPVSLALPLLFLAILLLLKGRRIWALVVVLLATSFREDVVVIVGCLAAAMVLQSGWLHHQRDPGESPSGRSSVLADALPWWAWLAVNLAAIVVFVLIYEFAGFREFQVSRFERLGDSTWAIAASPILRPVAFWGTVFSPESIYFASALFLPLGLRALWRGRWILLATALPLGVLVAWGHRPATSIAFQYSTTFLPLLFVAALIGSWASLGRTNSRAVIGPLWPATATALAGCIAASLWLGSSPWCRNTLTDTIAQTYAHNGMEQYQDRLPGTEGIKALHHAVALVDRENARVLATGRIAAHFVGADRLDTVGQAGQRWKAFQQEVGPNHNPIELFNWILIDTYERFQQSQQNIDFILNEAKLAGFQLVEAQRGVIVLNRVEEDPPPE